MDEKKIVSHFLNRGILMSPDVLINKESFEKFMIENKLEETDFEALSLFFKNSFYKIDTKTEEKNRVITKSANNSFLILLLASFHYLSIFQTFYPLRMLSDISIMRHHYYSFPFFIKLFQKSYYDLTSFRV